MDEPPYSRGLLHAIMFETITECAKKYNLFMIDCNEVTCDEVKMKLFYAQNEEERMTLFYYFAKQLEVEIEALIQGKNEPRFFVKRLAVEYPC